MHVHNVQPEIRSKALKYLKYITQEGIDEKQATDLCLNQLSYFIKQAVIKDSYRKSLLKIPVLEKYFSKHRHFIEALSLKVKETILGPGEYIQKAGRIEVPSLFIIVRGEVELLAEAGYSRLTESFNSKITFAHRSQGEHFGTLEFFQEQFQPRISVRTIGVTQI